MNSKSLLLLLLILFWLIPLKLTAQWTDANGTTYDQIPYISSFTVSGSYVFAGTHNGVFQSTDNGVNWIQVNDGLTNFDVQCLTVCGTYIFAGTDFGIYRSSISDPSNISWTQVNNGLNNLRITALINDGTNIFAGTDNGPNNGVYLSTNNGDDWSSVSIGLPDGIFVNSLLVNNGYIFVGTDNVVGIYRSSISDLSNISWSAANTNLTNTHVYALAAIGSNIYAGTYGSGVFQSTNNGDDWAAMNSGLPENENVWAFGVEGSYLLLADNSTIYIYTGTLWSPSANWSSGSVNCFGVSGSNIFAGCGGGIFLSSDHGDNWVSRSTGISQTNNLTVRSIITSDLNMFAGSWDRGVYLSTDNGSNWSEANTSTTSMNYQVSCLAVKGTNIFAATSNGIYKSPVSNIDWAYTSSDIPGFLNVRYILAKGSNLFAATDGEAGVYISTNDGSSSAACTNTGLTNTSTRFLYTDGTNLFVGTTNGGLFKSTDDGGSWNSISSGLSGSIYGLVIIGTDMFAASAGNGVFISNDGGANWSPVTTSLTNTDVRSLITDGTNLYAGTYGGGVFVSTDNGSNWGEANTGLDNTTLWTIAISGDNMYAGTEGGGIYIRPTEEVLPPAMISITFNVDMTKYINKGLFNSASDQVYLRGSFTNDWGAMYEMTKESGSYIYTLTKSVDQNTQYEYKYFINTEGAENGGWEMNGVGSGGANGNRVLPAAASNIELPVVYFNDLRKLFISDAHGEILKSDLALGNFSTLSGSEAQPTSVFFHSSSQNIYWANLHEILKADYSQDMTTFENKSTVLTDGENPLSEVQLNATNGKIYWLNGGGIQKSDMNGTNKETLVAGTITGYVLDVGNDKVYYIDGANSKVKRANLSGDLNEQEITSLSGTNIGIDFDPYTQTIYYSDNGNSGGSIRKIELLAHDNVSTVISGLGNIQNLVCEQDDGKLYLSLDDAGNTKIQRINYNGTQLEDIIASTNLHTAVGLSIMEIAQCPTNQASAVSAPEPQENQVTISWTRGNDGDRCIVFMTQGADVGQCAPITGVFYNAVYNETGSVFGSGTPSWGNGWSCVYNGTGNSVVVTGLTASTDYSVAVYEYNSRNWFESYSNNQVNNSKSLVTALPVELTSFTANVNTNKVELNWQTATEVNNFGFEIQRSEVSSQKSVISSQNEGKNWIKVGFVEGSGNSNSPKSYSFTDDNPTGGSEFQYRLKQIDNDGQFKYSVIVDVKVVPTRYELFQNYPNPFNPTTIIKYQIPNPGHVTLKLYDVLGREIKELVNGDKEAGIYKIEFNVAGIPSGSYFYQIISGEYKSAKKMMVLK